MKYILDKLIESLSNGNLLVAAVIVAVALIFNYKKVFDFFEDRKKSRIIKLSEALKCEYVQGLTKTYLENALAAEHFKIATGISKEKEFREAMIQAHRNANGEISFIHFKRALQHIDFKNSKIFIKITRLDMVAYWFNLISGCLLAFLAVVLMILPTQMSGTNFTQAASIFGMGIFFTCIAIFMLYETFPVTSARIITKSNCISAKTPPYSSNNE